MLRNLTIGSRSALAFGFIGLLVLIVGVTGGLNIGKLEDDFELIVDHRSPALQAIKEIESQFYKLRLENANILQSSSSQRSQYEANYDSAKRQLNQALLKMEGLARADSAITLITSIGNNITRFYILQEQQMKWLDSANLEQAKAMQNAEMKQIREKTAQLVNELEAFQKARIEDTKVDAKKRITESFWIIGGVMLFAIVCVVIFAVAFTQALVRPLRMAMSAAEGIAKGKLNQVIQDDAKDETGVMLRALDKMQTMLRTTVSDIQNASGQLAATAEELTAVTQQTSDSVESQNKQLEQSSTAVTELSASIEDVARSAQTTSQEAHEAEMISAQGKQTVTQSLDMAEHLLGNLQDSVSGLNALASDVNNIGAVLDVIRAIAEQTNLLALNAAIEAARAGETGRGFAVVADEVRALAHRTQESTQEIEQMIKTLQGGSEKTVISINSSYQVAQDTQKAAQRSGDAIDRITASIGRINEQTVAVASATEQQAHVSKDVDSSILALKTLSEDMATGSNQTRISSAELSRLAENLNLLTRQFVV